MFKRASLRLFAGMLFGAAGGVLWGVWFQASKWPVLGSPDEVAQMTSLLESIMIGAMSGFVVGTVLAGARNRIASGIAIVPVAVATVFLRPGFPFFDARVISQAQMASAGLILLFTAAAGLLIPRPKEPA